MTAQPLLWLALLVALSFSSDRRERARLRNAATAPRKREEPAGPPLNHRLFGLFLLARLVQWGGHLLETGIAGSRPVAVIAGHVVTSLAFAAIVVCSLGIVCEVMRDALEPVPDVIDHAVLLFRWLAGLALGVILLSLLPLIHFGRFAAWLLSARLACSIYLFALEFGLVLLLLSNLRVLGLFVMRRSVSLGIGLMFIGGSDLLRSLAVALPVPTRPSWFAASDATLLLAALTWGWFLTAPDRPRLPHAMRPGELLRTWQELAPQLAANLRKVEKAPFISGIEAQVKTVLSRYGVK